MRFSVVVPTLDEENTIRECLAHIREIDPTVEVVVADGGSSDNTIAIAKDEGGLVCRSARGRGLQMNAGARLASGDVLLFLHADTRLPSNAFSLLRRFFGDEDGMVGKFRLGFDRRNWFLRLCTWFTRYDSLLTSFGDHCIAVRRDLFDSLGGFPDWSLFEDVQFFQKARKKVRVYSLPARVITSSRRFDEKGAIRQMILNAWLMLRYIAGESPERLAEAYGRTRSDSNPTSLIVFARCPVAGEVKTRLAEELGDGPATEFYGACAERVFEQTGRVSRNVGRYVFYAGSSKRKQLRSWVGEGFHLVAQQGGDLGERMENAFRTVFERGSRRAIILATDVPDLSAGVIEDAIRALDTHDAVIGPCHDGGYYLLGIKEFHPSLFVGVPWSTERVLSITMGKLTTLGLSFCLLPALHDIDTVDDLRCWGLSRPDEGT